MNKSFAQILSEKLEIPRSARAQTSSKNPNEQEFQNPEPSSLNSLLGRISSIHFRHPSQLKAFIPVKRVQNAPTPEIPVAPKPIPQVKPRKIHSLTVLQESSQEYFKQNGISLDSGYFLEELKAAFHSLAKKLHPDRGGSPASFRELKEHFEQLKKVFTEYS